MRPGRILAVLALFVAFPFLDFFFFGGVGGWGGVCCSWIFLKASSLLSILIRDEK